MVNGKVVAIYTYFLTFSEMLISLAIIESGSECAANCESGSVPSMLKLRGSSILCLLLVEETEDDRLPFFNTLLSDTYK